MIENRIKKAVFILFTFLCLNIVLSMIEPSEAYWNTYFRRSENIMLMDWVATLGFLTIIMELTLFFERKLNSTLPWNDDPIKRLFIQVVVQISSALMVNVLVFFADVFLYQIISEDSIPEMIFGYWKWLIGSAVVTLLLSVVNSVNYLITNGKIIEIEEAEQRIKEAELKQIAAETELQAVKLQFDNNFVYNNLKILSKLILKDQLMGVDYVENFAKVYRYLLINSKVSLVSLKEELRFLDAYLFLVKIRIGKEVVFNIDIDDTILFKRIPPGTVLLLIENALNHNEISLASPLIINLYTNKEDQLVINNTIFSLASTSEGAENGLINIINRYSLISELRPEIKRTSHFCVVKVPLI
ncbi:MAG: histidine kinase [Sphingobacterium sp.]|jgi:sensor histidine kinase YesM|nr:histidine kinase [Sphingobacterium sp.]